MGKLYSLISALLLTVNAVFAASPDSYEWWFDHDVSSAQSGRVTDGKVDLHIDTSDLSKGIHYFNLRLAEGDSIYSPVYRKLFHAYGLDSNAISYEYWYDNDVEAKVSGDISKGSSSFDLDVSSLPKGLHFFNCRLGYGDGRWGSVYRRMFHTVGPDSGVISYEYWYDSDYDSKVTGSIDVGANHFELDISTLPPGAHYYNIRLGYGDGSWGSVYRKMVLNLAGSVDAVAYEYWIDNDYSAKIEGSLASGDNSYEIDLTGVRRGLHRFNYRVKTGEGIWGAPFTSYFYSESNAARFTEYEYWLDQDYANRVSGNAAGNPTSFEVDLSAFDKSGGAHYFNLRTRDGDGDWSPIYHKLIVFNKTEKRQPIIGYRHYLNGDSLGYVEVERQFLDSYMFDINLPDSVYPSLRNRMPVFEGDTVSMAATDSINYIIQIRTELGWAAPNEWKFDVSNNFSTTAVAMAVNSMRTFATPKDLEFAAVKFTSKGDTLYFRSDVPVCLDLYKEGTRVQRLSPDSIGNMARLLLDSGEYYGLLYEVQDTLAQNFTFHIMSTPNLVPDPEITFEEGTVSISCIRSDAEIRYSLDGSNPDEKSELYAEPFPLKRNAVVKAVASVPGSDIVPSSIVELEVDSYKVDNPTGQFDVASRLLTLTCETKDATIMYSQDFNRNDTVNAHWTTYVEPVKIRRNGYVYSKALLDGYNDSDIVQIEITELPDSVIAPRIDFKDGMVTITCDSPDVEIRYTLDGTAPTKDSNLYETSFALARNAEIKAFAYYADLDIDPSDIVEYVVDSYKVADPYGEFNAASRLLEIKCDTKEATIFYSFSLENEWTPYSEPIVIRRNCVLHAYASCDGYKDSEIVEIAVTELPDSVFSPIIDFKDGNVTISCETTEAEIHYTLDGTEPTEASTLYDAPFALNRNAVVKAIAIIPDLDIDPSEVAELVVDSYKVATPTGEFEVSSRQLTLNCETEGASISYTFDREGEWTEYTAPISVRRNCEVYARATFDGYNDSDIAEIAVTEFPDKIAAPVIDFKDGKMTISCETTESEIHYTLDGTEPTVASTLYEAPFALNRNAVVKAIAIITDLDIDPSDVAELVVDSYKVATPTGVFDSTSRQLTLSCATEGALISYTFDKAGDWTDYTAPISVRRNCVVYARATFDGYNDSDIAEIAVTELPDKIAAPFIDFKDGNVTISCETTEAEIHYTLDGTEPTVASTLYDAAFALNRNAVVKAIAIITDLDIDPSDVAELVVDSYKVSTPTGVFDSASRQLTLSCATEGALISYTFDNAGDWTDYTAPISVRRNCVVYARATFAGYNDSDIAEIVVSAYPDKIANPTIAFADGKVSITCATADSEIRYTIDGTEPTTSSTLYESPFSLGHNAEIKAIAYIPGLDIDPSEVSIYKVDSYKVATPTGVFDSASRILTLSCETEGASIFYSFDKEGEWNSYIGPVAIDGNCTVYAKATLPDYNDSNIAEIVISDIRCAGVNFSYNGRYMQIATTEPGARILYTTDGSDPSNGTEYYGELDIMGLCNVRAIAVRDRLLDSEIGEYYIDRYSDEVHAATSAGGLLESSFEWSGSDLPHSVESFRVEGILNDADYRFLNSMKKLRHLDIEKVADAHIPDKAFLNSRLISVSLPEDIAQYGEGIFSDAECLSSLRWNSKTQNMESRLTDCLGNPNMLVYVPAGTTVGHSKDLNIVTAGRAASVTLQYGYPYYAAWDLRADLVSMTRDFRQETAIDVCRGWETLVLPFSPTDITHETLGEAVPFAAWDGQNDPYSGAKPFWLYGSTASGWEEAAEIEAGVPYIISMPNNPDYVYTYNLAGRITFSAKGVDLGPDSSLALSTPWMEGTEFEGTFMPVDEDGILTLNVADNSGDYLPGSTFVAEAAAVPFSAYVRGASGRKAMPVFGDTSSLELPTVYGGDILIETPAPGMLRICSGRDRKVDVITVTGVLLRTLHLKAGEPETLEGLTRDLYIVGGVKVMVR